jgi:hypothetical protein
MTAAGGINRLKISDFANTLENLYGRLKNDNDRKSKRKKLLPHH